MRVKVADFSSRNFEKDFIDSILNTGFAVIVGHGISHSSIAETQAAWRNFFLQKQELKDTFLNYENPNLGYHGFKKEKALGAKEADLKEFFHFDGTSKLPKGTEGLSNYLYSELFSISSVLLEMLDSAHKDRKMSYKEVCQNTDNTILRSLYYPALDFEAEKGAVRAAAHEDVNFITLLVAASAPGLEVMDSKGNWHEVPHSENAVIVNVGDMLQCASEGYFRSTTHRVINPQQSSSDRLSLPLFIHPHSSTILQPGVTAKRFLEERIEAIYTRKS